MHKLITLSILTLLLFGCKKFVLETIAKQIDEEFWEQRPPGVACTPAASNATIKNGELSYDRNHVFCIDITMNGKDFKTMRNESRFGPSILEKNGATALAVVFEHIGQCDVPFPSYYNWYTANVTIDGISIPNCGIRKKGFAGSIFSSAPALKINTLKKGSNLKFGNSSKLTLNNNSEDPSRVIQPVFYKFITKVGYPSPRCNAANVKVNGEALGPYLHLESINEDFLQQHYGNSSGHLYEGAVADFVPAWLPRWEAKTDATNSNFEPIRKIGEIVESASDATLISSLEQKINLDKFITFWALEVVLGHIDGYSVNRNNFYVYFDPADNGKAHFIPWGMNYSKTKSKIVETFSLFVNAELPRRLSRIPSFSDKMKAELERIITTIWNESELLADIDFYAAQIKPTQINPNYDTEIQDLKNWITGRKATIQNYINAGIPKGNSKQSKKCYNDDEK